MSKRPRRKESAGAQKFKPRPIARTGLFRTWRPLDQPRQGDPPNPKSYQVMAITAPKAAEAPETTAVPTIHHAAAAEAWRTFSAS